MLEVREFCEEPEKGCEIYCGNQINTREAEHLSIALHPEPGICLEPGKKPKKVWEFVFINLLNTVVKRWLTSSNVGQEA